MTRWFPRGRRRGSAALPVLLAIAGCVLPEPINIEPAPQAAIDQVPVIVSASPEGHIVRATQSGNVPNQGCEIQLGLNLVLDTDTAASLTCRVYLNEGNGAVQAPGLPIQFGGQTDLPLQVASQDSPQYRELDPPVVTLDLDSFAAEGLLTPLPAEGGAEAPNFLELVVSDGFSDGFSPTPAPGHAVASAFWFIDLSLCDPRIP